MQKGWFDIVTLVSAINNERLRVGASWRDVAQATGVPASTLTRMKQGRHPDVESFAKLIGWLGGGADEFLGITPSEQCARCRRKNVMIVRAMAILDQRDLSRGDIRPFLPCSEE